MGSLRSHTSAVVGINDASAWDVAARVAFLIKLALGTKTQPSSTDDWNGVFALARHERCAGLVWMRSADFIKRHAPTEVTEQWRSVAYAIHNHSVWLLERQAELLRWLFGNGVDAISLKGPTFSHQIYGIPGARRSGDIDIFVRPSQRDLAEEALLAAGWVRYVGQAPYDAAFYKPGFDIPLVLELHSFLWGEILEHLPVPPIRRMDVEVLSHRMPVLHSEILPVYFAANVIGAAEQSLLLYLDFDALWGTLDSETRTRAYEIAKECRLTGVLSWSLIQAARLHNIAHGDATALRLFLRYGRPATTRDVIRALLSTSESIADGVRIIAAALWPNRLRRNWHATGAFWMRRLTRLRRRHLAAAPYSSTAK